MDKKQLLYSIGAGIIGLMLGFIFFSERNDMRQGMHRMPGGHMMSDHEMHSQMLMDDMMNVMMRSLEGKTGDRFDKAFLDEMIPHHEGAVLMAQKVLEVSERPELRKLAEEIIIAQEKEITQMETWKKEWFK